MAPPSLTARARTLLPLARNVLAALHGQRLQLRAMALTYLSLFALVPALVVAFSVVQAFTGMGAIWQRLDEFLLANLAVGARNSIAPYLTRFVKNAHAASAGVVGGALLVYSALSLFRTVEQAANDIWHVRRRRPAKQLLLTYWAGLTLGPVLLASSLTLGHSVEGLLAGAPVGRVAARAGAVLLTCAFFAVLYLILPATKVRLHAALAGGAVAGLAFEIAKALYTFVVARFFRYHAVYGSLAAFPIFLIWLQVSWTLLLFGARVAFVVQHVRVFRHGHAPESTPLARERLAAEALLEVALAFHRGTGAPQAEEVAERVDALPEPVRDVLVVLGRAGLVVELASGGIVPARPLRQLTLADVRAALSGDTVPSAFEVPSPVLAPLAAAEGAAAASLAAITYEDLCARCGQRTREERPIGRALSVEPRAR
jgi:membrane protein